VSRYNDFRIGRAGTPALRIPIVMSRIEEIEDWENIDLLIVGAGPVGCVIAERAATMKGWTSLIIDKRTHIAGNCYDQNHESGVLIHRYGPHYFRTNNQAIYDYLSQYTDWIDGNYVVKSYIGGELFPFPINLTTLEKFFHRRLTCETAKELIETLRDKTIQDPKNSEELVLSRVGRELYEAFYLGYTLKQWERHPRDLDPAVCGRIPVRFNHNDFYVDHKYRVMPKDGFTKMFTKMISHPKIRVRLSTGFEEVRSTLRPRIATVYTGPIDSYFGYIFGRLPWRSLEFDFKVFNKQTVQPCVQINYPSEYDYTRSAEIKHITRQQIDRTVVSYEYSKSHGDPYYPVPAAENRILYQQYEELAREEQKKNRVFFSGRLARYTYINTDEAVQMALDTFYAIAG
jgi:UDP-galactopyranose mutase